MVQVQPQLLGPCGVQLRHHGAFGRRPPVDSQAGDLLLLRVVLKTRNGRHATHRNRALGQLGQELQSVVMIPSKDVDLGIFKFAPLKARYGAAFTAASRTRRSHPAIDRRQHNKCQHCQNR